MNLISILGLLALLGIAWAISYHPRRVKLRPVLWGLGLQLVFALIILREGVWSFIGMALFGGLLVVYLCRGREGGGGSGGGSGSGSGGRYPPGASGVGFWAQLERLLGARDPAGGVANETTREVREALVGHAVRAGACGAAGGLALVAVELGPVPAGVLGWVVLGLAVLGLVLRRWNPLGVDRRLVAASLVSVGVAALVANDLYGQVLFASFSEEIAGFLNLSDYGARFIFGNLADPDYFGPDAGGWKGFGFQFGFKVLPTIIFFGGFMGVLYYLGIVQLVIAAVARFMRWTFGTSGAETLSCSANIFVGQTEAPLLIRPFIGTMTRSELLTIMVGGFATIAGGVLAGYIAMGVPAGHLVAATVMSAPAALAISKIIFPELEHSATAGDVELPSVDVGTNAIEAASSGITDGLKLAVNVGAMLIGFIALINVADVALNALDRLVDGHWLGGARFTYDSGGMSAVTSEYEGVIPGSLRTLFGTALKPLAYLLGVPWEDAGEVGNLLGIKLSLNEFVSFGTLGAYIQSGALSDRAIVISTYALCGFANFASIGIQIGGLTALAPGRRSDLASVGVRAMIGGALASWTTATVAGILV